jgi:hypothetical protein
MTIETTAPNCIRCGDGGFDNCELCDRCNAEIAADDLAHYRQQVLAGVRAAFRERAKCDDNWELGWLGRWWHTAKLAICVLLGRDNSPDDSYGRGVEVAIYHYQDLYAGWESESIRVGHGVFRNWWFEIHRDGDWWM